MSTSFGRSFGMQMLSFLDTLTTFPLAELEVGNHFYWQLGGLRLHGQVFITSWVVIGLLLTASVLGTRNIQRVPQGMQNFMEYALEFVRDIARNQLVKRNIALGCRSSAPYSSSFLSQTGQEHCFLGG